MIININGLCDAIILFFIQLRKKTSENLF